MPEGQFTGSRSRYVYEMDDGRRIILTLDDSLVLVGGGLTPFDPAAPPANVTGKPDRFSPRQLLWEATAAGFEGKRKSLVVGTNESTAWTATTSVAITIDGVAGKTTGKKGERFTF